MMHTITLIDAIRRNDVSLARRLLEDGADVNEDFSYGFGYYNVLNYAIEYYHIKILSYGAEMIELLLEYGADMYSAHYYGAPVTEYAAWRGDIDIISIFIKYGFDVNYRIERAMSLLNIAILVDAPYAIKPTSLTMIRMLLENGFNPNPTDASTPPLLCATARRDDVVIRLLLEWGATPCAHLIDHCRDHYPEIIQYADELDATRRKYIGRLMKRCGSFEVSLIDLILSY